MVHTAVTCAPNTLTSQLKGDTATMKPCPHQPTSTYSYTFAFVWFLFIIVKILVFPSPTGYMLTFFKFSLLVWGIFSRFLLNDWLFSWSIELQLVISQTQTGSSATSDQFFPFIGSCFEKLDIIFQSSTINTPRF